MKHSLKLIVIVLTALLSLLLSACNEMVTVTPLPKPKLADELVFYNWVDDTPQEVLDAFSKEYGVKIKYETYESQEEAIRNIKAGKVYDVVVVEDEFLPALIQNHNILKINYANIPNFQYIGDSFKNLAQDPDHRFSVPYDWGTTGLLYRSDLVKGEVTSWNDLWGQAAAGKVLLWKGLPRHMLGLTLKTLGYPANTENPAALELAVKKLNELKSNMVLAEDIDPNMTDCVPVLIEGKAVMAVGWNYDAIEARKQSKDIKFILPKEGPLLWGDNFVIPANSPNQYTAELFLNFLLRPEISAKLTSYNYYPTANEKSKDYIDRALLNDPVIFPPAGVLRTAESILPLSSYGEKLYEDSWKAYIGQP